MLDACTSGGVSGGSDTEGIFQLAHRYAVFLRDVSERLSCEEETDDVLNLGAAAFECRLPKASSRISDDVGETEPGQRNDLGVSVGREFHTVQIVIHDVIEHMLAMTDHHQFTRGLGLIKVPYPLRVVVQNF